MQSRDISLFIGCRCLIIDALRDKVEWYKESGMDTNRLIQIYNSYISECIDDYVIGFYFSSSDCILESYKVSEMLG